jgi:hypothetical protein
MSGNFVMIVRVQDTTDEVRIQEDGFAVFLTPSSYGRVIQALRDATEITVAAKQNRFSLHFPG